MLYTTQSPKANGLALTVATEPSDGQSPLKHHIKKPRSGEIT